MYSVITATENETINDELKKIQDYNVVFNDIAYQEALMEIIKNKPIDKVLVYENLSGKMDKKDFFELLVESNKNAEIIVIVDKIDNKTIEFFNKLNIVKFIDSKKITIENMKEIINQENKIKPRIIKEFISEKADNNVDYNKKVIMVAGNNGSGKTTFATNLAITLAKNTDKKVLLIDMDTLNANIETFLDVPKTSDKISINLDEDKQCVLNCITECIQKNIFDFEMFSNVVIQYGKYKNLDIVTGNTSMFVCQNVLCEKYYNILFDKASQIYDYIIIDTNSNLFLDSTKWAIQKSNIIYFVLEGTYRDLKNLKNSLFVFLRSWDIPIDKFKIVLNKTSGFSLKKENIKNIISIDVLCDFEYSQDYIKALNSGMPVVLYNKNILEKYERIIGIDHNKNNFFKMLGGKISDNKPIKNK